MHPPNLDSEYPISITEDNSRKVSKKAKPVLHCLIATSAVLAISGIVKENYVILILSALIAFPALMGVLVIAEMSEATTLLVDEKGVFVHSRQNASKCISLDWPIITGVWFGSQSPQSDGQELAAMFSSSNFIRQPQLDGASISVRASTPLKAHRREPRATATITYSVPRGPEWRDGREQREYQFSQTFGMSQQAFFDFLKLHFERNKRA